MRKRLAVLFVTLGVLAVIPQGAAEAKTVHTKAATASPFCFQQNLPYGLHLQIGYCP